jgi:hypothetical protein
MMAQSLTDYSLLPLLLSGSIRVVLEPESAELGSRLAESPIPCGVKRRLAK